MRAAARIAEPIADRRQLILEAAVRVVADAGVEAVTHRRVAAEAGVPLGSTTYYFASRDDLIREAFRHYAERTFRFLADLERELPRRSAADLIEFLVEMARREFATPSLMLAEYELILRAARDRALAREFATYEEGLVARLAEAMERLGAAQPFDAARTVVGLVRGFELEQLTRPDVDVDDLRRRLTPVVAALTGRPIRPRGGSR